MYCPTRSSFALAVPVFVLLACSQQSETSTSVDNSIQALRGAQSSYRGFSQTAVACFKTYRTCAADGGGDITACLAELSTCLPAKSPTPTACIQDTGSGDSATETAMLACHFSGSGGSHHTSATGGAAGSNQGYGASAGATYLAYGAASNTDQGYGASAGSNQGHGNWCNDVPVPPPSAVVACQGELQTCLGAADADHCAAQYMKCAADAFTSPFQTRCARAATECDSQGRDATKADLCALITDLCAHGVDATTS
jgi:hypothetical protein